MSAVKTEFKKSLAVEIDLFYRGKVNSSYTTQYNYFGYFYFKKTGRYIPPKVSHP